MFNKTVSDPDWCIVCGHLLSGHVTNTELNFHTCCSTAIDGLKCECHLPAGESLCDYGGRARLSKRLDFVKTHDETEDKIFRALYGDD